MKTLLFIKNELAQEVYNCTFTQAITFLNKTALSLFMDKVAKRYAEETLKELLSRIDSFPIKIGGMDCYFDKNIILNLINELK